MAKPAKKPGVIRSDPLSYREGFFRAILRTLPAWLASIAVHAVLITLFAILFGNSLKGEEEDGEKVRPDIGLIEDKVDLATFENIEIGNDPEREINFPVERIEDQSIPGPEDPTEATGLDKPEDNNPLSVPAPPGDIPGQGALEKGSADAAFNNLKMSGGYFGGKNFRPGGMQGRSGATRQKMLKAGGGTDETEAAVARGLMWLQFHQAPAGNWSLTDFPKHARGRYKRGRETGTGSVNNDTAGTAFGLLPFLAAGHTHKSQSKYQKTVNDAIVFLMKKQNTKGSYGGGMYSHGLATIAMCEAYGLSGDPRIKRSAQRAINYIVYAQDPGSGGWRYQPKQRGDTSVVGWQLMALKSGQMAGLNVPTGTLRGATRFLDSVETTEKLAIERDPQGQGSGRKPSGKFGYTTPAARPTMTSVGLLCRQYLGARPDNPSLLNGVCYMDSLLYTGTNVDVYYPEESLKSISPAVVRQLANKSSRARARYPMKAHYSNTYMLYYATQVMHHMGGWFWEDWNKGIWVDANGKQERPEILFEMLDANEDGKVDKTEVLSEDALAADEDRAKRFWTRIVRADNDKNDSVTRAELNEWKKTFTYVPGMQAVLLATQAKDALHFGSWDPKGDRHGRSGGRVMKTSLCLLTLEVYYRHLPLYRREMATGKKMMKDK